jgi:replicative DNA helicase
LRAIGKQESFRGRGLLARFLYAVPPSMVGYRRAGAAPVAEAVEHAWHQLVHNLAVELADWHDPAILILDEDAQALALDIERDIEPQLRPSGELGHIADWGAKLTGATLRIAALLHVAQHPTDGWRREVGADTVRRAVQVADYYRAHALVAFDSMRADPTVADAEYLLDVLNRLGRETTSTRDLHVAASRSRFPKVGDLGPSMVMLEDHGYIRSVPMPEQAGPGRPHSPLWSVNPHILAAKTTEPL